MGNFARILALLGLFAMTTNAFAEHTRKIGDGKGATANACIKYSPGANLEYATYRKRIEELGNDETFSVAAIDALADASEIESLQAIYEVFANAKDEHTQVFYGDYTEVGKRTQAKDGGHGFRVMWQRTVDNGKGDKRLISVITFWSYKDKKFHLLGGNDMLRVRSQIEPSSQENQYGLFHAHALALGLEKGRVSTVDRVKYFDKEGKWNKEIPIHANPKACANCHYAGSQTRFDGPIPAKNDWDNDLRKLRVDESKLTAENIFGIERFLEKIPKAEQTPALLKSFTTPRETFFPKGILEALDKRCKAAVALALAKKEKKETPGAKTTSGAASSSKPK